MSVSFHLDIVSAEESLYSGRAQSLFVMGEMGELGIYHGHTPLLTSLQPGQLRIIDKNDHESVLYVASGIVEVQPQTVTVLADTAAKAEDLDEAAAQEAKKRAEKALSDKQSEFEYSQALRELAQATAQLRVIKRSRSRRQR
jgi:F-type H+-transporting ATPase subunit epsilon